MLVGVQCFTKCSGRYAVLEMPSTDELKQRIEAAIPGAAADVETSRAAAITSVPRRRRGSRA